MITFKQVSNGVVAFTLSLIINMTAMADDLEIYLGSGSSQITYNPNVLFIMDTSGSMASKDGTSETRMLRVQNALKEALRSATNINAGLMRFSDHGGPILFPVSNIDAPVAPEIITPTTESLDDVYELNSSTNVSGNQLYLTSGIDMVHTGLRYQSLNIPRGAIITSAYVRFVSRVINTGTANLNFSAEAIGNATQFQNVDNNVSARTVTSSSVNWSSDNDFPVAGEAINSPDISAVIQEIVNRNDWCGGNSLNIIIEGTSADTNSARRAQASDDGIGGSPQLVITYDDTSAAGCIRDSLIYQVNAQYENAEERSNGYQSTGSELTFHGSANRHIGIRFSNINMSQNAQVSNAYLEFTAYQHGTSNGARMTITGSNESDADDFSPYKRFLLRDKPKTASVNWENIPPWYRNGVYQSPPITNIVQQIINRSDWSTNNEMMFILSNFTNAKRGAYAYNGKPSGAVRLVIEFEGNATPGSSATVREHLISKVDQLSANGLTPIVDTLYEAALYFGGMDVQYGLERGTNGTSNSVRRRTRVSHRNSYTGSGPVRPFNCNELNLESNECINEYIPVGAKYISPVQDLQCQTNNHIVMLSDGEANNNHSVDEIEALLQQSCTGAGGEKCGIDLVKNISDTGDTKIEARVITHGIGFAASTTANNFLNQLALQSGGGFYQANNSADLVTAFQTILRQVKDVNATFVSPGVAVNQLNRLTHRDELYFALFKPSEGTVWPGNLKKYRISGNNVLDKNGLNAVDSGTGFFGENSHSYWSPLADGNDVRQGGASSRLDLVRNVFTFDNAGDIAVPSNVLSESNSNITETQLGVQLEADPVALRDTVLKWARGVDVRDDDADNSTTDVRLQMGDPIHSQPVIVNYSATDSAIFVATNHGFLHSFDAETGEENFSIIPSELLGNLYEFYKDASTFNHVYGMDGDMVLRTVGTSSYLYVGMRRGGNNYYVFDVTNKISPKLVFKIIGGQGDFVNLGQTWSRPTLTKIDIGGSVKNVMIIGGGYDEEQDTKGVKSADNVGNSVYIIDADDGSLLWSASNANADLTLSDMRYSIPARISVVDRNNDGLADHMYVADMGGQLFRLDIYNGNNVSGLVKGGLMASLGGDSELDNRRFYYGADVSEISLGDEHFYAVAIGSGFRAGPLNTNIKDSFYMIKDTGVFSKDENGEYLLPTTTTITESALYDATEHLLTSLDDAERDLQVQAFSNKPGWFIRLTQGGEKVLASPLILDYQVFFTTYLPASASNSLCAPPTGNSRAYLVNLLNGNGVDDLNKNSLEDKNDRFALLSQTGIAPDTKILIENIVKPVVCLGAECVSAVIELDANGNEIACGSAFECLARNIYGRFERVQKNSWKTEVERN